MDVAALEVGQPPWMREAVCVSADPETFFPDRGMSVVPARKVCRRCPVIVDCLRYAVDGCEQFGVWGGLSPIERRSLRHRPGVDLRLVIEESQQVLYCRDAVCTRRFETGHGRDVHERRMHPAQAKAG